MKRSHFIFCLFLFATSLFAFSPEKSFIEDRAKFLSEDERKTYTAIATELHDRIGFSLYLYTAESEVRDPKRFTDSLQNAASETDSLSAFFFVDGTARFRAFSCAPATQKFISADAAESIAQKVLLPEFRKGNPGLGILLFEAEVAKNVARMNDIRLKTPLPRPTKEGIPTVAWVLIFAVIAVVIVAYAYFAKQASEAKRREKIREFGGFPHQTFDSGFGE